MKRHVLDLLVLLLGGFFSIQCFGHQAGVSYLIIERKDGVMTGQWKAAVRDLELAVDLDGDGDGKITWGELRVRQSEIESYFSAHLTTKADGHLCNLRSGSLQVEEMNAEMFVVLSFVVLGAEGNRIVDFDYTAFFDYDAGHRGIFQAATAEGTRLSTFSPSRHLEVLETSSDATGGFGKLVNDGIWHIWTGADHILFLLSLLLPSVLRRDSTGWQPTLRFNEALSDIARTVTAFTVAHSITLALASLRYVIIPSKFVEIAIATSVVFAALNNVYPLVSHNRWAAAFGFGLLHGFGFAGVLTDLNVSGTLLAKSLLGFNLGVEVGQMAIVAGFLPLAFFLRNNNGYRRVGLQLTSSLIALIATVWICERLFGFRVLPI